MSTELIRWFTSLWRPPRISKGSSRVHRVQRRAVLALPILLWLGVASIVNAQARPDPLADISKVSVLVVLNATGSPPPGISERRLQTVLELRLRTSGMRVLTEEEHRNDPDINPYLYLRVGTLETRNQGGTVIGYTYRLDLSARVFTFVPFNRATAPLELWADDTMAVAPRDGASADIEQIVGQLTDSFLNAWLRANPRQ